MPSEPSKTSGAFVVRVSPDSMARNVHGEATDGWEVVELRFNSGDHSAVSVEVYADGNFSDAAYLDDLILREEGAENSTSVLRD